MGLLQYTLYKEIKLVYYKLNDIYIVIKKEDRMINF